MAQVHLDFGFRRRWGQAFKDVEVSFWPHEIRNGVVAGFGTFVLAIVYGESFWPALLFAFGGTALALFVVPVWEFLIAYRRSGQRLRDEALVGVLSQMQSLQAQAAMAPSATNGVEPAPAKQPTEMDDDEFISWYEANTQRDPLWPLALPYTINGISFVMRYDRIKGTTWAELGSINHLGVKWIGKNTSSGVVVFGPYCPADDDVLLVTLVVGLDARVDDSTVIGGLLFNSLRCRTCGSKYLLETNRDKMEKIGTCKADVRKQFERKLTTATQPTSTQPTSSTSGSPP